MKYLLDTNYVYPVYQRARARRPRKDARYHRYRHCYLWITKAEMFAGAAKSQTPTQSRAKQDAFFARFISLPFDDSAADVFGRIRATLETAGTPIGPYDMQIAAVALVHGLILVTHNLREFGRIGGLRTE